MRHLWSLLAGVVAAPLAWLFISTGQHRAGRTAASWEAAGRFDTADLIGPALFLAGAGVLLGLLGTLRWSPAGPLAAGVLFLVPTAFMFVNPFDTLDWFSYPDTRRVFSQDFQPWLPVANGTTLVLGALLLMAVFSSQRWRRWPAPVAATPPATQPEVTEGVAALTDREQPSEKSTASLASLDRSDATMSDEEILAAAAAIDEQTGTTGDLPTEPAEPEPEPTESTESTEPETDTDEPERPSSSG
jgi:hypothetical protein